MRYLLALAFLILQLNTFAQSGAYERKSEFKTEENLLIWTLTLNADGTFLYNFYRKLKGGIPPEENFYGKGNWKSENNLIFSIRKEIRRLQMLIRRTLVTQKRGLTVNLPEINQIGL